MARRRREEGAGLGKTAGSRLFPGGFSPWGGGRGRRLEVRASGLLPTPEDEPLPASGVKERGAEEAFAAKLLLPLRVEPRSGAGRAEVCWAVPLPGPSLAGGGADGWQREGNAGPEGGGLRARLPPDNPAR